MTSSTFQIYKTTDGSPTLLSTTPEGKSEHMHHRQGAFSETVYVYGWAIQEALKLSDQPRFFSLGLGLGYVELCIAALAPQAHITTYESEPELREAFLQWLQGHPSPFESAYNEIQQLIQNQWPGRDAKTELKKLYQEGCFTLNEAFSENSLKGETVPYAAILYDAFSDAVSPALWEESFLENTVRTLSAPQSVFATYASKGRLKRALEKNGFRLLPAEGFGGKRECTMAMRTS